MRLERPNGVVVMPITRRGVLLTLPNHRENVGKRERTNTPDFKNVEGKQLLGGAIELQRGETEEGAAIREAWEEGKVGLRSEQLVNAPFGVSVEQEGRGYFGVEVFIANLTLLQEFWLRYVMRASEVGIDQPMSDFRVRDQAIIQLARESGVI